VERFGRHADEGHDLQELLLPRVAQLLDVVAACNNAHGWFTEKDA
jgi:hypothetical protein